MGEQARHEARDLDEVTHEVADRVGEWTRRAAEFARERPHVAVGVALGVGWVLGNGLHPRVLMGALRVGWKAALGGALAGTGVFETLRNALGEEGEPETAVRASRPRQARTASGTRTPSGSATPMG